jgi:hypothetical protein
MLIRVIYKDKSAGMVEDFQLARLLPKGRIVAFQRSSGWVSVEQDPIRGHGGEYHGPDRRKSVSPKVFFSFSGMNELKLQPGG